MNREFYEFSIPEQYANAFGKEYALTIEQISLLTDFFSQCQINTLGNAIKVITNNGEYGLSTTEMVDKLQNEITILENILKI